MTLSPVRPIPQPPEPGPGDLLPPELLSLGEALMLNRVAERAWQICDSRQSPSSPGYLLGFVEQTGDGVELMQLGNKFIWTSFPTMRDALAHVTETAQATAALQAAGDLAWIS